MALRSLQRESAHASGLQYAIQFVHVEHLC
jgi:hypothetical protein